MDPVEVSPQIFRQGIGPASFATEVPVLATEVPVLGVVEGSFSLC